MAQATGSMQRRIRSPRHPFNIKFSPYQITPHFIAAVLPNETLKHAMIQAKAVSAPIKNDLLGASLEQYYYYIPARFLAQGDKYVQMMVDPNYNAVTNGLTSTTDKAEHYFAASTTVPAIDFVQECLYHVTQEFFRDEDELPSDRLINGRYAARVDRESVIDSLAPASAYSSDDINVDLNANATITASEVSRAMATWQQLVANGLTDKSYADYLRSYGIRQTFEEEKRATEIRVIREWTQPTRLVEPSTGVPTAAWGWTLQDRIDKARYMKEPGFLFGITVCRPKVYLRNVKGTMTSYMQSALSWLPGEVLNSLAYGLPEFATLTGPHETASVTYKFDLRDLLQYGEQFVNFDLASTSDGIVALPSADCTNTEYVSWADVQALFTGTDYNIRMDGIVNPHIASHLGADITPNA